MSFIDKVKYLFGVKPNVKPTHDARLPRRMPPPPEKFANYKPPVRHASHVKRHEPAPVITDDQFSHLVTMSILNQSHHSEPSGCSYDSSSSDSSCSSSTSD